MMTRFMTYAIAALGCFHVYGQQEPCKPNYQFVRSACVKSGQVEKMVTTKVNKYSVNNGACKEPEQGWISLCNEKRAKLASEFPGARAEDVVARTVHTEVAGLCGSGLDIKGKKLAIACDFEVTHPEYKMETAESCPIIDVVDSTGCADRDSYRVDAQTVTDCLGLRPETEQQWWQKAACLSDLNKAAHSFGAEGLNAENAAKVTNQLDVAIRVSKSNPLIQQYLLNRKNKTE